MQKKPFMVTRENHLNHMVKVVPLIVAGYALQCYFFYHQGTTGFVADSLLFLGACLGLMIAGFVTYDLKHSVVFGDHSLDISFFSTKKTISYEEILSVTLSQEGHSFATLTLELNQQEKHRLYFIDDAEKIKIWLSEKRNDYQKAA